MSEAVEHPLYFKRVGFAVENFLALLGRCKGGGEPLAQHGGEDGCPALLERLGDKHARCIRLAVVRFAQKVAELMSDVADMKLALIDANENNRHLEKEKEELAAKLAFKAEKTKYENGFLYEVFEDETVAEFPFCQNCMTNGKFVRIIRGPDGSAAMCPGCKTAFDTRSVMYR